MTNKEKLQDNYSKKTDFIYGEQTWAPLFADGDGKEIDSTDNNARKYIIQSLEIMKIGPEDLKDKTVFNIGSGREAKIFVEMGAKFVTHFDISQGAVKNTQRYIEENNIQNLEAIRGDIQSAQIEPNKYDIIFLAGVYQHIKTPAIALVNFINMLKPGGIMYMGFYRSGEWKYFIVDAIRYLLDSRMLGLVKKANSILHTFNQPVHYQNARLLDDFFVPYKHNFHPNDVIHDIELLGGEVYHFDNDFRDYNHEGTDYFSIGGDRIYVTKKHKTIVDIKEKIDQLKTKKGRHQLFDMEYKEDIIKKNIELIKQIRQFKQKGRLSDFEIVLLAITMYQFTRPFVPAESEIFQESIKKGRHKTLNVYMKNFIENFVYSENR